MPSFWYNCRYSIGDMINIDMKEKIFFNPKAIK